MLRILLNFTSSCIVDETQSSCRDDRLNSPGLHFTQQPGRGENTDCNQGLRRHIPLDFDNYDSNTELFKEQSSCVLLYV